VGIIARINNPSVRDDYVAFLCREVGVDRPVVERALRGKSVRQMLVEDPAQPLDRAQAELFRVALSNPPGLEVSPDDFTDRRLGEAFQAVSAQLDGLPPGAPVDVGRVTADPHVLELVRSMAMDTRPLPEFTDIKRLVASRRIDAEIDELEQQLQKLDPGSQPHSERLRRLIALQQKKRELGH
jgi:hypothetical protein